MTQIVPTRSIDPAFIAAVARKVVARLREGHVEGHVETSAPTVTATVAERLVTIETLRQYEDGSEVTVAHAAVVTPAAKDEARQRSIVIKRQSVADAIVASASNQTTDNTIDQQESVGAIDDAVGRQLARRGVTFPAHVELIWTQTPAKDVFTRCQQGKTAAMVTSVADVDRFATELSPTCWVLDKHKLNLIAAVNIAARITQRSRELSR